MRHNKILHQQACQTMENTQRWAISRWEADLKRKLGTGNISSKLWWSKVKDHQSYSLSDSIPPLNHLDGTIATSNLEKAELLTTHFPKKMEIADLCRQPPKLPW